MDGINTEQYMKSIEWSAEAHSSVNSMPDSQKTKTSCNLQRRLTGVAATIWKL